jgi:hypothetical protein
MVSLTKLFDLICSNSVSPGRPRATWQRTSYGQPAVESPEKRNGNRLSDLRPASFSSHVGQSCAGVVGLVLPNIVYVP